MMHHAPTENARSPVLSVSIFSADFARLGEQAREALDGGADWLHIDVLDGHFAPNLSMGPVVVEALRPLADETGARLDVHLMITRPDRYLADFAAAGADHLTVHAEATVHLHRTVQAIKELGCTAGVALNPATPLLALEEILPNIDLVLIMSVNPGFSGQSYIPGTTARVDRMRQMLDAAGSQAWLEVDGGINPGNVGEVVAAGATAIVAATAIYRGAGTIAENIAEFRAAWGG